MKGKVIDREGVIEKFGVPPEKVIEVQALIGDSTDNVPGAPGIGPKTAVQLLAEYGDLDTLLARAHEIKQPKRRESLIQNAELIRISRRLVTLGLHHAGRAARSKSFGVADPDPKTLIGFLKEMEFRTLVRRVEEGVAGSPAMGASFAPVSHDAVAAASDGFDRTKYRSIQDIDELAELGRARPRARPCRARRHDERCRTAPYAIWSASRWRSGRTRRPTCRWATAAPDDLMSASAAPKQIPLDDAIEALRPMLEDPAVMKVGVDLKREVSVALAPRRHRRSDRRRHAALLRCGERPARPRQGRARRAAARPSSDAAEGRHRLGQGRKAFAEIDLAPATEYAAEAADVAVRLWTLLKPGVHAAKKHTVYETLERPMLAVLADMEQAGVKIDPRRLGQLSSEFTQKIVQLEAQASEQAGRAFNLGSPKQIGDVLFGELGMAGGKKTKTGAWSTDVKVLDELAEQGHVLPRTILDWRMYSKLKSTYTDTLRDAISSRTDRVHTTFSLAATPTGASPPPTRTCRTSRCAPRKGGRSAPPSSPRRATC